MLRLFQLLILLTLSTSGFSQGKTDSAYGMTFEENKDWLAKVSHADKGLQLTLIKNRLVENRQTLSHGDQLDAPVLIIDGIPIEDEINDRQKEFLNDQLRVNTTNIQVLEKGPDGLYVNKAFTGVVLIVITDKKTSKKFKRLR